MKIISPAFSNNEKIPQAFTCLGKNTNPPLFFEDIPHVSKSLVLTVGDIDSQNNWTHWLVFNIPPTTTNIVAGEIPSGATEGLANNNTFGYEGPCPKYFSGIHRYRFTLYALSSILAVPKASTIKTVTDAMEHCVIQTAELLGLQEGLKE